MGLTNKGVPFISTTAIGNFYVDNPLISHIRLSSKYPQISLKAVIFIITSEYAFKLPILGSQT